MAHTTVCHPFTRTVFGFPNRAHEWRSVEGVIGPASRAQLRMVARFDVYAILHDEDRVRRAAMGPRTASTVVVYTDDVTSSRISVVLHPRDAKKYSRYIDARGLRKTHGKNTNRRRSVAHPFGRAFVVRLLQAAVATTLDTPVIGVVHMRFRQAIQRLEQLVLRLEVVQVRVRLRLMHVTRYCVSVAVVDGHEKNYSGEKEHEAEHSDNWLDIKIRQNLRCRQRECTQHHAHSPNTIMPTPMAMLMTWMTAETATSLGILSGTLPVDSPVRAFTAT